MLVCFTLCVDVGYSTEAKMFSCMYKQVDLQLCFFGLQYSVKKIIVGSKLDVTVILEHFNTAGARELPSRLRHFDMSGFL